MDGLEFLEKMASSTGSTDEDCAIMQELLHRCTFHKAVVTCGIVYLEGVGTLSCPPTSIHTVAEMLLRALKID